MPRLYLFRQSLVNHSLEFKKIEGILIMTKQNAFLGALLIFLAIAANACGGAASNLPNSAVTSNTGTNLTVASNASNSSAVSQNNQTGAPTPSGTLAPSAYKVEWMDNQIPKLMPAGKEQTFKANLKNTGDGTWAVG